MTRRWVACVVGALLQAGPASAGAEKAVHPLPSCEAVRASKRFNVYFENVDLDKLVQAVADATCRTFIVPDNVKGKVSILGPEGSRGELDGEQFYAAFLSALDANGLTVVKAGPFVRIIEKAKAAKSPVETETSQDVRPPLDDTMVTRLFRLKHAELEPLRGVVTQLLSPGAEVVPYPPDTLIVTEVGPNLERLQRLVAELDVAPPDDTLRVVQLKYAAAGETAEKLQRILDKAHPASAKPAAGTPGTPSSGLSVMADERTNKLVILGTPAGIDRALDLLEALDVPLPGDGQATLYPLKNAEAKDVASTLEPLLQGAHAKQAAPAGAPAPTAPLFTSDVRISASEADNALVVVANAADYRTLVHLIDALDQPRRQVFLEAAILEIDLEKDSDLGISFHDVAQVGTSQGTLPVVLGTNYPGEPTSLSLTNLLSASGALLGIQGPLLSNLSTQLGVDLPQFGLILHALQQTSNVNVVSTPHLLALDNKEAVIHVGQRVPFQTGYTPSALQQTTSSGAAVTTAVSSISQLYAPITRENVELKITIKPHVGDGDEVRMEVDEQTEEIASTDKVLGPTTSTRGAKTTVVAADHRTVVLGGIMQDRTVEEVSKIPLLGDLPLLGNLFRTTTKKKTKTNLLLFLTPHIIRTRQDFDEISRAKTKERESLLEEFWGERGVGEVPVDFAHKRGPLAAMGEAVRHESNRPENGGEGNPGEHRIQPAPPPDAQP